MTVIKMTQFGQPYAGSNADIADFINPARTTAQLDDITNEINTLDKFSGRSVWNSTLGQPVWADGNAAGDTWSIHDGSVIHSPEGLSASGVTGFIIADESVVIAWDDVNGFGDTGPTINIFDDFRGGANDAEIPLTSPQVGAWDSVSAIKPKYSTEFSKSKGVSFRSLNLALDANYGNLKAVWTASNEFFISYWWRIPEYWPGQDGLDSPFESFPSGSHIKLTWVLDGDGADADGTRTDINTTQSPTRQGSSPPVDPLQSEIFALSGNSGNIPLDDQSSGQLSRAALWGPSADSDGVPPSDSWFTWSDWMRFTFWFQAGADADVDPGTMYAQAISPNKSIEYTSTGTAIFNGSGASNTVDRMTIVGFIRGATSHPDCRPHFDDIYIATGAGAPARVEIGNNAVYANCTDLAIATITAHSNTEITCILRSGEFSTFANLFIHIHDKDNNLVGASRLIS